MYSRYGSGRALSVLVFALVAGALFAGRTTWQCHAQQAGELQPAADLRTDQEGLERALNTQGSSERYLRELAPKRASRWHEAADSGDAIGQYLWGRCLELGLETTADLTAAAQWYSKAANQGNAFAQNNLGLMYQRGRGVAKDEPLAVQWYRKAADQGLAAAQANLGGMYENGQGVAKDEAQAVNWYRKAAEQGLAVGQLNLGVMYDNGRGVAKDAAQALQWFQKAAKQGNAAAQRNLGTMYQNGRGVSKDDGEAVRWYQKAADQGHAAAQNNLGVMYFNGYGVATNSAQAVIWFRKAADQGDAPAQSNLGLAYSKGWGVPRDEVQAVKWYQKAVDQGYANAQGALGYMYENGQGGLPNDFVQAFNLYKKAAEQGNVTAQTNLGAMYANGRAVAMNPAEAEKWFRKAADSGDPTARGNLELLHGLRRDMANNAVQPAPSPQPSPPQGNGAGTTTHDDSGPPSWFRWEIFVGALVLGGLAALVWPKAQRKRPRSATTAVLAPDQRSAATQSGPAEAKQTKATYTESQVLAPAVETRLGENLRTASSPSTASAGRSERDNPISEGQPGRQRKRTAVANYRTRLRWAVVISIVILVLVLGNHVRSTVALHFRIADAKNNLQFAELAEIGVSAVPVLSELLLNGNSTKQKLDAIEALVKIGPNAKEAIPALVETLKSYNAPLVHRNSLKALEQLGMDGKALLKHEDTSVRLNTLLALGEMGAEAKPNVPQIIEVLSDKDSTVRTRAVEVLAKIGPDISATSPALIVALKDKNPGVRRQAYVALRNLGTAPNLIAAGLGEGLQDDDVGVRQDVIQVLASMGPDAREVVPRLIEALKDKDANVHGRAFWALQQLGVDPQLMLPTLIGMLKDDNAPMRSNALITLGRLGPNARQALPAIILATTDKDRVVREWAVRALGKLGPNVDEAIRPLIAALKDSSTDVQGTAANSLGEIGADAYTAVPALIAALEVKDNRDFVRENALRALEKIGPGAAGVPALIEVLNRGDPFERDIALRALQKMGPDARPAVPVLIEVLTRGFGGGPIAIKTLRGLGVDTRTVLVPKLIEKLDDPNPNVRVAAIQWLGEFGPESQDAVLDLMLALQDPEVYVRQNVVRALGDIGPNAKEAIHALNEATHDKQNFLVQEGAKEALVKIGPVARKAEKKYLVNSIGMQFAKIAPGRLILGSPRHEPARQGDESPHRVVVTQPYYLGVFTVTQEEYEKLMGENPSRFKEVPGQKTGKFPVESVSWHDAQDFCKKLSALPEEQKAGRTYRLPTEAEWEYACRAGELAPFSFGKECNGEQANCRGDSPYGTYVKGPFLGRPCKVGAYAPNSFGLHDMHGNMLQWCSDWYGEYKPTPLEDPSGPEMGKAKIVRGGSWNSDPARCRSACRSAQDPTDRLDTIGFRVALSLKEVGKR